MTRQEILQAAYNRGFEKGAGAKWRTVPNLVRLLKSRNILPVTRHDATRGHMLSDARRLLVGDETLPGLAKLMKAQPWQAASEHPATRQALTAASLPVGESARSLGHSLKLLLRGHLKPVESQTLFSGLTRRIGPINSPYSPKRMPVQDLRGVHASPVIDNMSNYLTMPAGKHGYGLISTYRPTSRQLYAGDWGLENSRALNSVPRIRARLAAIAPNADSTSLDRLGRIKGFFHEAVADPAQRVNTVLARTSTPGVIKPDSRIEVAAPTSRTLKAMNSLAVLDRRHYG